ncbi:MAG: tail fiber domain-containing protein [Patescibacteria group bacterium]
MSSDLIFGNKKYISVKEASTLTSYSTEHIGELCRDNKILSKRIGKSWYVGEESILKYRSLSANAPAPKSEKNYLPVKQASFLTGYSRDYIGKLCREGKVESRRIGQVWYVEEKSLLEYKNTPTTFDFSKNLGVQKKDEIVFVPVAGPEVIVSAPMLVTIPEVKSEIPNINAVVKNNKGKFFVVGAVSLAMLATVLMVKNDDLRSLARNSKNIPEVAMELGQQVFSQDLGSMTAGVFGAITDALLKPLNAGGTFVYNTINGWFEDGIVPTGTVLVENKTPTTVAVVNPTPTQQPSTPRLPVQQPQQVTNTTVINNPVVERIVERLIQPAPTLALTSMDVDRKIQEFSIALNSDLARRFASLSTGSSNAITNVYQQIAHTNKIDNLTNVTVGNPTITGGTISNAVINNSTLNGSTLTNATSTNFFITNLTGTNSLFTSATTTNLFTSIFNASTGSIDSLSSALATITGLNVTNSTTTNSFVTNFTGTNILGSFATVTNATTTNFFTSLLNATTGSVDSLTSAIATITGLNITNSTTTNATSTNMFATNANIANLTSVSSDLTNLLFTNATGTNATTTSLFSSLFRSSTGSIDNLSSILSTITGLNVTNSTTTNATTTNSYIANLSTDNGTFGNIDLTNLIFTNATGTNATTTNFFSSIGVFDSLYVNDYQQNDGTFLINSTIATGDIFTVRDNAITSGNLIKQEITANAGNGQISRGQVIDLIDSTVAGGGYSALEINVTGAGVGSGDKTLLSLNPGGSNEIVFDSTGALRPTADFASNNNSIGSPSFYWKNGYFNTITANNLSGTVVTGDTSSDTWTIGSSEAGDNLKAVIFQRNSGSGNATFQWNSGVNDLRYLSVNYPFNATYTVNDASISTAANLYSGLLTNNTTGGIQRLLSVINTGTGTTENGLYISNTGTGTTALEIAGTWTNGIVTNNNTINAGSGNITTTGTGNFGNLLLTGSTTLQNFSFVNSTGVSATTTNLFSTTASSTNLFSSVASIGGSTFNVTSSGRVGIGTTAPGAKLVVSGSSDSTYTVSGLSNDTSSNLINTDTTNNNFAQNRFLTMDTNGVLGTGASINAIFTSHTPSAVSAELSFATRDAGTYSERLRITSGGNVGVGSTTPGYKLSVAGSGYFDGGTVVASNLTATSTITASVGSVTTPSYTFASNSGYGMYLESSALRWAVNGTLGMRLSTGNLTLGNGINIVPTTDNNADIGAVGNTWRTGYFGTSVVTPSISLSGTSINSLLSTNSSGAIVATSTPTFGNFNATSTTATSTISTGGLAVGTSQFVVQQNSGNVGIGTSNPFYKLQVADGNVALSGSGSSYLVTGPTAANFGHTGFFDLNLQTNGLNRLTVLAGGNVGVGTTSPYEKFSVDGNIALTGTVSGGSVSITGGKTLTAGSWTIFGNSNIIQGSGAAANITNPDGYLAVSPTGELYLDSGPSSLGIHMRAGGVEQVRVLSTAGVTNYLTLAGSNGSAPTISTSGGGLNLTSATGNVGVGTTSPYTKFSVADGSGTMAFQNVSQNNLYVSGTNATLVLDSVSGSFPGILIKRSGTIDGQITNIGGGGGLAFYGNGSGGAGGMFLSSAGNVGIGSTTPGYKLSVAGSGFFDGGTVIANIFTATTSISTPSLTLSGTAINSLLSTNSSGAIVATSTPTFGNFNATSTTATSTIATGGLAVGTSQFVVQQNSGRVGLGTATPAAQFHMSGISNQARFQATNGNVTLNATADNGGAFALLNRSSSSGNSSAVQFQTAGTNDWMVGTGLYDFTGASNLGFLTGDGLTKMTLSTAGNLGIGTTNPLQKLAVSGEIRRLIVTNGNPQEEALLTYGSGATSLGGIYANNYASNDNKSDLIFKTSNGAGTLAEVLRMTTSANVGIGTTPSYRTHISGAAGVATEDQILQIDRESSGVVMEWRRLSTGAGDRTGELRTDSDSSSIRFANAQEIYGQHSTGDLLFMTGSAQKWRINATGHFLAATDNTLDIGASGATRPRTLYVGTSVVTPAITLSGTAINSLLSTNSSGALVATSTPTFGNFNATSTNATSTIAGGLAIETSGLVYDYSTNNVGIGTASPVAKLQVNGLAYIGDTSVSDTSRFYGSSGGYSGVSFYNGSTQQAVMQSRGDISAFQIYAPNYPIIMQAADGQSIGLGHVSDAYRLVVSSSGNVGIATTTPWGKLSVTNTGSAPSFVVEDSSSPDSTPFIIDASGSVGIGSVPLTGYKFITRGGGNTNASYAMYVENSDQTTLLALRDDGSLGVGELLPGSRLSVSGGATIGAGYDTTAAPSNGLLVQGNVGVGTSTPQVKLEVSSATSNTSILRLSNVFSAIVADDVLGSVQFFGGDASSGQTFAASGVRAKLSGISEGASGETGLSFYTAGAFGGSYTSDVTTEKMRITNAGNVGIGTSTPSYLLDIDGDFRVGEAGSTNALVVDASSAWLGIGRVPTARKLEIQGINGGVNAQIALMEPSGGLRATIAVNNGGSEDLITASTANIRFFAGSTIGNVATLPTNERMVISSTGNVGIGTTTPQWILNPTSATAPQLALSAGGGISQWVMRNAGGNFYLATTTVAGTATTTTSALSILGSSGFVGLGTTSPSTTLDVNGGIRATLPALGANTGQLVLYNSAGALTTDTTQLTWDSANDALSVNGLFLGSGTVRSPGSTSLNLGTSNTYPDLTIEGTNGNVGIGTTNPQTKLDVQGTASSTAVYVADGLVGTPSIAFSSQTSTGFYKVGSGQIGVAGALRTSDGSASSVAYGFSNDASAGMYRPAATSIAFATAGTARLTIDGDGEVGIGTESPQWPLTVYKNTSGTNPLAMLEQNSTGDTSISWYLTGGQQYSMGIDNSDSDKLKISGSGTLGTSDYFTIDNTGRVGVGTSGPTQLLQVAKTQDAVTSINILNQSTGTGAYTALGQTTNNGTSYLYTFGSGYTTSGRYIQDSMLLEANLVGGLSLAATDASGVIRFYTNGNNERMRVASTGNVGIGTTTPTAARLTVADTSNTYSGFFQGSGSYAVGLGGGSAGAQIQGYTGTFATANLSLQVGGGNVGIGTTDPGARLTISNAITGGAIGTAFQQEIVNPTAGTVGDWTGTVYRWIANNANTNQAYIGAVLTSGAVNTSSDLVFGVKASTAVTAISEAMRIKAGGNVGIGTTNPTFPLSVQSNSGANGISIIGRSNGSVDEGTLTFLDNDNSTTQAYLQSNGTKLGIFATGGVGIGLSSPTQTLEVKGIVGLQATNSTNFWGMYNHTDNTFRLNYNNAGNDEMVIESTGDIGIGTADPAHKLDILGDSVRFSASGNQSTYINAGTTSNYAQLIYSQAGTQKWNVYSSNNATPNLEFASSGGDIRVAIEQGGDVGIGTASPDSKLSVSGSVAGSIATFYNTEANDGNGVYIKAGGVNSAKYALVVDNNASANLLTVLANGGVGVGTSIPSSYAKLAVSGGVTNSIATISGAFGVDVNAVMLGNDGTDGVIGMQNSGTKLHLLSRAGGVFTKSFTLDSAGNVGIGTTDATNKLTVAGAVSTVPFAVKVGSSNKLSLEIQSDGDTSLYMYNAANGLTNYFQSDGPSVIGGGTFAVTNLVSCGGIQTNGSGTMSCTSDERLKDIQSEFTSGLSAINQINPQTYSWKTDSGLYDNGVLYSGFIAQNIQQAIPDAVNTNPSGTLQVNTTTILAAAINAIQELDLNTGSRLTNLEQIVASSTPESTGINFNDVLDGFVNQFETVGAKFVDGIAYFKNIIADRLTVGSSSNPTGITIYDEVTNDPYCMKMRNGAMVSVAGICGTQAPEEGGGDPEPEPETIEEGPTDSIPPVITITGSANLQIPLNSNYSDLGATVTDLDDENNANNNLGIYFNVNGVDMLSVSISTNATATHTIVYSAMDEGGNWSYATRTVEVIEEVIE